MINFLLTFGFLFMASSCWTCLRTSLSTFSIIGMNTGFNSALVMVSGELLVNGTTNAVSLRYPALILSQEPSGTPIMLTL